MKKIFTLALVSLFLASCSGNKTMKSEDSASQTENKETEVQTKSTEDTSKFYLTSDSIGPIHLGLSVNELPRYVASLYDQYEHSDTPDAMTIIFLKDNKPQFIVYDFGEAEVDVIATLSQDIKVNSPNGPISLGDPFTKVLSLEGAEPEWVNFENDGMWHWKWEGLWFAPAQNPLPEKLVTKLFNHDAAPEISDFTDEVKIDFIGTGLPY